jgi:hypothetical protein
MNKSEKWKVKSETVKKWKILSEVETDIFIKQNNEKNLNIYQYFYFCS